MSEDPTVRGVAIYPDKRVEDVTVTGLAEMQAIVDGNIEAVELSDGSTMYVDEEYLYNKPRDAINSIAMDVCGLGGVPHLMFQGILGPVLVLGPVDDEGWNTDVTDKARKWIRRVGREAGMQPASWGLASADTDAG